MVGEVRDAMPEESRLKVILETGELADPAMIRLAADLAIEAGADFIKTSTGKTPVSATPEAVAVMLAAIQAHGGTVGLKPSGGIRTPADAGRYLAQVDAAMGPAWATPATFRFGASGLHEALVAAIEGRADGVTGTGY
jgi:deoxyribose-phosphate aldolase